MRKTCLNMVYELAKQDPRIVFIGSDLGHDVLREFRDEMPERFFMEGVAEANIIGMAAGFALEGKIPYVNTIATFITRRCFDQVAIDLCYHNLDVRLIGNGGGFVYAPLGPTHEAIEDIAIMSALPNMTVLAPADAREMTRLMPETLAHRGPLYIRLAKGYDPVVTPEEASFSIGRGYIYRHGGDALVATTGVLLGPALAAADELRRTGIGVTVVHCPTVKPLDETLLRKEIAGVPVVVSFEEHSIRGGLGSALATLIAEADFPRAKRFRRLGIPDVFPDQFGTQASLLERYGLTSANLMRVIRELLADRPRVEFGTQADVVRMLELA